MVVVEEFFGIKTADDKKACKITQHTKIHNSVGKIIDQFI